MNEGTIEQAAKAAVKKLARFRKIETHQANPANELIELITLDEKGAGGAHHRYMVYWPESDIYDTRSGAVNRQELQFQKGPIEENGVNGLTHEVLLAIVADRLECFQAGPYACDDNQRALEHVQIALNELKIRTLHRQARGVEGRSVA